MDIRRMNRFLVFLICLCATSAFAGTSGKIAGKATDKKTGEGLIGVNVVIQEMKDGQAVRTTMGAATDMDGNYMILNVPPGTYTIRASMIGYKSILQSDVSVSLDLTTKLKFELDETTMQGEEVMVVAKRKIVRADLTSRAAVVSDKEIAKAPVEEIEDILRTQSGVTKDSNGQLHIRGGRAGEVAYWIDGVSVTDAYNGNMAIEVENTSVKEMQVISGAFNAEFGQAMSGIVNIATKDGGSSFHGSATAYWGDFISNHGYDDFKKEDGEDDPEKVFMNMSDLSPLSIQNYQVSLDGPLLGDQLSFFVTGRFFDTTNQYYGKRIFDPTDYSFETIDPLTNQNIWIIQATGDSAFVAMNPYQKATAQFKLTYKMFESVKLSYNALWSSAEFQDFDHELRYNPDGNLHKFEDGLTNIFKLTHTVTPRTYYDLSATFTSYEFEEYTHKNLSDYTIHPYLWDNRPVFSFRTGGENMNRMNRRTETMIFKLDVVSQMGQHHQMKAGVEARRHDMFFEDSNIVPDVDENGVEYDIFRPVIMPTTSTSHDKYTHNPTEFSVYLQDKIEYEDIIINWGLRYDYFSPDGKVLTDPTDPNINNPLRPAHKDDTYEERLAYWYEDAKSISQVSPRIGIAYPMTEGGVMHFSYGHFFQTPKFERLYQNPEFEMNGGTGVTTLMGNAELKPEKTVSYEIGLQQQFGEDIGVSVDVYYRDVRELVSSDKIVEVFGGEKYSQFVNRDYGNIRGVAFSVSKRYSNMFSASLDYTFQIAEGNASNPDDAFNDAKGDTEPEKKLIPLNWDQRHLFNLTLTFSRADNWSFSLLSTLGSGFPYTPSDVSVGSFSENSSRKPALFNVDLKASKDIKIGSLHYSVFINVYNLLDRLNEEDVYTDTGRASYSIDEQDARASTGGVEPINSVSEYYRRPDWFSNPRRVQLGLSVRF